MKKFYFVLVFLFFIAVFTGCSLRIPDITIRNESTTLEKQLIGTYQKIEDEPQMVVSSDIKLPEKRIDDSKNVPPVLDAIRNRRLNQEKIDEFKQLEIIGEQNRGFLEIINPDKIRGDQELFNLVTLAVEEENKYREIILSRVLSMNENINETTKKKIESIYAKINKDNSAPGTWIQFVDGSWIKKE